MRLRELAVSMFAVSQLFTVAACKDERGPVTDGISQVQTRYIEDGDRIYLETRYTVRLAGPPIAGSRGVAIKAACQVGGDRFVDFTPGNGKLAQGTAVEMEDAPFVIHPLPGKPTLCDLEFVEMSFDGNRSIGRFCWNDTTTAGACPPNHPAATPGPTGITVALTSVKPEPADDIGFPAHLTVSYRVTAHRDMPHGAYLVRATSCPGTGSDDTWHDELGNLRAGEAFAAGQNTYRIGRPAVGTPCETRFSYSPVVNGELTEITTFCHVDDKITPGPCPP